MLNLQNIKKLLNITNTSKFIFMCISFQLINNQGVTKVPKSEQRFRFFQFFDF